METITHRLHWIYMSACELNGSTSIPSSHFHLHRSISSIANKYGHKISTPFDRFGHDNKMMPARPNDCCPTEKVPRPRWDQWRSHQDRAHEDRCVVQQSRWSQSTGPRALSASSRSQNRSNLRSAREHHITFAHKMPTINTQRSVYVKDQRLGIVYPCSNHGSRLTVCFQRNAYGNRNPRLHTFSEASEDFL